MIPRETRARVNTGRVIIGLAHIPPPRPIRSADELRLQAALLEPRTAHPAPLWRIVAAWFWRYC